MRKLKFIIQQPARMYAIVEIADDSLEDSEAIALAEERIIDADYQSDEAYGIHVYEDIDSFNVEPELILDEIV